MRKYFFPFLYLLCAEFAYSQETLSVNIDRVKFNLLEELSLNDQFLDSQFYYGRVTFTRGSGSSAYFNYNVITNELYFLDQDNRAFMLVGLENIAMITYGKRTFIPVSENEVAEVIKTFKDGTRLLLQRQAKIKHSHENRGAYGTSSEMAFSNRMTSMHERDGRHVVFDKDVTVDVSLRSNLIIIKEGSRYPIRRTKDLKKLYPMKWDDLKTYIKENNIDLSSKEDVISAIVFCID